MCVVCCVCTFYFNFSLQMMSRDDEQSININNINIEGVESKKRQEQNLYNLTAAT